MALTYYIGRDQTVDYKQIMAKALLGQGAAAQAADTNKLHPIWQEEYANAQMQGQSYPQFEEWIRSQTPNNQ